MSVKKIVSYVGLGVIAAIIICVIILACVPVRIMPNFENMKPNEIKIYNSDSESYIITNNSASTEEFNNIFNKVNDMATYSVLDSLFMGVMGENYVVKSTSSSSKNLSTLISENDYVIQFDWAESQQIKNADGTDYSQSTQANFKKALIGISNNANAKEVYIYLYTSLETTTAYYAYVIYANTQNVYNYCENLDNSLFA